MPNELTSAGGSQSVSRALRWLVNYPRAIPLAIFLAIAAVTALGVFSIENNARAGERAQAREYAQSIASSLERRGTSFASYLRAGAALFSSFDEVDPQLFSQFAAELRIDLEYRGAEGIGWIEIVDPDELPAFVARNRALDTGFIDIRSGGASDAGSFAPVTFLSPDTQRNRRALGFDMYSEPVRAAALAEATRTVRPTASGRVVLAQEGAGDAPGFVIFMPVYKAEGDDRVLAGFVYSPFNAAHFLEPALDAVGSSDIGVRLYDDTAATDKLLVSRPLDDARRERVEQAVTIANRELQLVVETKRAPTLAPLSMVTLVFGIALGSLLMLLARLLTRQALEDQTRLDFLEEQHSIRNSLTRELNHRVKNTLANVLSILSLTRRRASDLDEFADGLEGRIRALSATHDLLTQSDWGTIPLRAVIEAELQHFRAVGDHPITLEGPTVELAPNDALSFGLAVHELATNAAKFGSLSTPGGAVSIIWQLSSDRLAQVEWREVGGPAVQQERKRGFGTELIEKIVAHELRHPVELEFDREGVRCVMRVPVRQINEFQIRQKGRASADPH